MNDLSSLYRLVGPWVLLAVAVLFFVFMRRLGDVNHD